MHALGAAEDLRAPDRISLVSQITYQSSDQTIVKKAFTNVDPQQQLNATYPGIISTAESAQPFQENRLVGGYLIVVATERDSDEYLNKLDPAKLAMVGDGLRYEGKPFPYTYAIYNISTDARRGGRFECPVGQEVPRRDSGPEQADWSAR